MRRGKSACTGEYDVEPGKACCLLCEQTLRFECVLCVGGVESVV